MDTYVRVPTAYQTSIVEVIRERRGFGQRSCKMSVWEVMRKSTLDVVTLVPTYPSYMEYRCENGDKMHA